MFVQELQEAIKKRMQQCRKKQCKNIPRCKCREILHAHKPIVWLLGTLGSGIRGQVQKIVETYNFTYLSTDDLLQQEITCETPMGNKIKRYVENRQMVPERFVVDVLYNKMQVVLHTTSGYLITGYPKVSNRGDKFEKYIAPPDIVIQFDCGFYNALKRIKKNPLFEYPAFNEIRSPVEAVLQCEYEHMSFNDEEVAGKYEQKLIRILTEDRTDDEIFDETRYYIDELIEEKILWRHNSARWAEVAPKSNTPLTVK